MATRAECFRPDVRLDMSGMTDDDIGSITGHPKPSYSFRPMRPVYEPAFNVLEPCKPRLTLHDTVALRNMHDG